MKIKHIIFISLSTLMLLGTSCTKDALDKKQDITIASASTISDYQYLLDGIEGGIIGSAPGLYSYTSLGDYLSDEYTTPDDIYNASFSSDKLLTGIFTWNNTGMFSNLTSLKEWDNQYKIILYANVASEGINNISPRSTEQGNWNLVKGMALFIRGQMFYNLAQFWAKPYNTATAKTDMGIVLRKSSDATAVSVRSSVEDTYQQIISDFKGALKYLTNTSSANTQLSKVRPSKAAAYGALARTYLTMGDYTHVQLYADSALQLYSKLLDYNTVYNSGTTVISYLPNFNAETVFYSMDESGSMSNYWNNYWFIRQDNIALYDDNDLRKTMFFMSNAYTNNMPIWDGDYSGSYSFTGIAVDELYLMRAEANARLGNTTAAMTDLNALLVKRYKTGTFTNLAASDAPTALNLVLLERRKELIGRGIRWTDIRRLGLSVSRTVNGVTSTLSAGDSRYTLQVPNYVISASNGSIVQTP